MVTNSRAFQFRHEIIHDVQLYLCISLLQVYLNLEHSQASNNHGCVVSHASEIHLETNTISLPDHVSQKRFPLIF